MHGRTDNQNKQMDGGTVDLIEKFFGKKSVQFIICTNLPFLNENNAHQFSETTESSELHERYVSDLK